MIKPTSGKTVVSNTNVTVTLDADQERINVPCIQTYRWKEKLAVLMQPRIQVSLQGTKTLILKPGKRLERLSLTLTANGKRQK